MKTGEALVLICDGTPDTAGDVIAIDGVELPDRPVTVTRNFDPSQPVGFAKLRKEGDKIFADFSIMDAQSVDGWTPAIGGATDLPLPPATHGYRIIEKIRLTSIGLSEKGNTDPRIQPLKDIAGRLANS